MPAASINPPTMVALRGLRDHQNSTNDQIAFKNLQFGVTEEKSDFTEGTLISPHAEMMSSLVIPQLLHERDAAESGTTMATPCTNARPHASPRKPTPANQDGTCRQRVFALLPSSTGTVAPPEEPGLGTELSPRVGSPVGDPHKGFASITITARRVNSPASTLPWGTVRNPLCPRCRMEDLSALAGGSRPSCNQRSLGCPEFSRNGSVVRLRVPEVQTRLCERRDYWVTSVDDKENSFSARTPPSGQGPLVFSSCVHLRVSQQCPNSIYYLDKSLFVPIQQPPATSPQLHRSVLSLNLNCSSHGLTADGVDGLANGEPRRRAQSVPSPRGNLASQECHLKRKPSLGQVHLGAGTCSWRGFLPLERPEFSGVHMAQATVGKGDEDHSPHQHTRGHAGQLSIHIPGWSYTAETKVFPGSSEKQQEVRVSLSAPQADQQLEGDGPLCHDWLVGELSESPARHCHTSLKPTLPLRGLLCPLHDVHTTLQEDSSVQIERECPTGDYTCCDLVLKIKGCKKSASATAPEPSPSPPPPSPSPPPAEGPETLGLSEISSRLQQTPAGSLTLQEALEVRKPQFISRSQERLKKLERMVQQRKTQQKEGVGQTQSTPPVRASKKQFTVPHPLSDNLFKPKERCISEKEMHMRSKRIYNNLPEVKKKKEEQKKRVVLQSNRLRAEVFKKQLLDQLLQRNAV
ncbi:(E2-independent) E3 ubiquitin-conjugating enzyme FATS isoform X2 [Ochotona princeps]|uniref:(E2-independent) E3 ubiquitin-conjugating enzyme FATS isoform X2 n=1 Tax=Ochotona princeps TaxID=9978 RepID=UPI002714A4E9|nr:(E2-independent) E3 ubiquitin-conjugating enzyme FATS isoform X2 [Ochotona princeps]